MLPEDTVMDGWVGRGQPRAGDGSILGQEDEEAGLQGPHGQHAPLRGCNLAAQPKADAVKKIYTYAMKTKSEKL